VQIAAVATKDKGEDFFSPDANYGVSAATAPGSSYYRMLTSIQSAVQSGIHELNVCLRRIFDTRLDSSELLISLSVC